MKKLFIFAILSVSLFGFVGCLDDNDRILTLDNEPAVVEYSGSKPMIRTAFGRYYVPELSDTIHAGDNLLVDCIVNFETQPTSIDTLATNLIYKKIGGSAIKIQSGDMTDSYSDSIVLSSLYNRVIKNTLFFEFKQRAPKNQVFDYEIICNTDSLVENDGKKYPVLYIRSKRVNALTGNATDIVTQYAFDMTRFASNPDYRNNNNETLLYLKYKTGTKNGKDVYTSFENYPIHWAIP